MALRALILGTAAGGGLPQWNCNGPNSATFWRGGGLTTATQSSLAVTGNGSDWALLNCSPDIRQQIIATPALHPRAERGMRDTPIHSILLTNGDIDHIAGLLILREKQSYRLLMTAEIARVIAENPIFNALDPDFVSREVVSLDQPFELVPGMTATLFAVPGKVPLFMEGDHGGDAVQTDVMGEQTVGVSLSDGDKTAFYIPGCARMVPALEDRIRGAALLFFDGTLWQDDEMIAQGVGVKTGKRMGHMSMSGPDGSMATIAPLNIARKVYVHINNTNPVWRDGPERAEARANGWEIGYDGMEVIP
ncbi:pyrroloquinoline quinone biosynthesis protein PqqB [Rhodobacteraceae bacterium NNCM2]|nr:pyrroloquinoline quinone biosynthesis protein PqqB [Coraliihabitans acroporae]